MPQRKEHLDISDHARDRAGLKYVYPVVSRRANGVSIGINLNTNNACNWACVYCQVPDLIRGGPEAVDLERLGREFSGFLQEVMHGNFMQTQVAADARQLADIAFSGNGEPTASAVFADAVDQVIATMRSQAVPAAVPLRLITNGSQMHRPDVRRGIGAIGEAGGEVWFKVDRATRNGIQRVNQVRIDPARMVARLRQCAELAPTWVQTCWFGIDGCEPADDEVRSYLAMLNEARYHIRGVLLYGIARQPMQPGSTRLYRLPAEAIERFGREIESAGVAVKVSP